MAKRPRCRSCNDLITVARLRSGRDYCKSPECIAACSTPTRIAAVGVAKSIPQFVPVDTVTPDVARSGHRRA